MFKTALEAMSEPMPSSEDLDEWHEWSLKMGKGTFMLSRYLWNYASRDDKVKAKTLIENYVRTIFEKYYISGEGAFSYYPDSNHATLDGTGGKINGFADIGFYSVEKQKRLWGNPEESIIDLGVRNVSALTENEFALIAGRPDINSLRFYGTVPDLAHLTTRVLAVAYPKKTLVRDIMDFTPKVKHWLDSTPQSMGTSSMLRVLMLCTVASLEVQFPILCKVVSSQRFTLGVKSIISRTGVFLGYATAKTLDVR
jgi:hypothetical protein